MPVLLLYKLACGKNLCLFCLARLFCVNKEGLFVKNIEVNFVFLARLYVYLIKIEYILWVAGNTPL